MVLKRIILITLLMWPFLLYASDEEALCIHTKEGYQTFFFFQNKPKVVIKDNILEITTSNETVKYPLDKFVKFTFEKAETTSIDTLQATSYTIKSNTITTKGRICVYDISGKVVAYSESGEVCLSSAPQGLYLIKTSNTSFKYLKK